MKVLVVEDDPKIASFVEKGLREAGFVVDRTEDSAHALQLAQEITYDVAVIDIMLPKMDGLSLIDLLRRRGIEMPILVLSAKHTVDDRIKGLDQGADDYMVKPFIFAELLARVHALVRRSAKPVEANRVTCGDLVVDLRERKVRRGGQTIELQPKEYTLLEYLLRHRGRTVSKTMIMEHVWDLHFDPQTNVVDVLVCRLRNKIDKTFPQKLIQTIRGIGYIIDAMDISEAQAGTMRLSIQPMDFVPLAESLAEMYRYVGEERGIQIETDFPSQARLEADADRISQVLANLLDNAMKFSAPGAVVRVTILNQPGHVQIQVADTGIGISADEIPRIWDRLYRGTQATHQGLGLGLSLVKAVVQAHRGDVQVTSAPGAGTTFIVQLPVQHQP